MRGSWNTTSFMYPPSHTPHLEREKIYISTTVHCWQVGEFECCLLRWPKARWKLDTSAAPLTPYSLIQRDLLSASGNCCSFTHPYENIIYRKYYSNWYYNINFNTFQFVFRHNILSSLSHSMLKEFVARKSTHVLAWRVTRSTTLFSLIKPRVREVQGKSVFIWSYRMSVLSCP
jgi:hypothetical protein